MTGHVASQWAKQNANQSYAKSPYLYGQVDTTPGVFPTGFVRNVKAKNLAVVDQSINATSDRRVERFVFGTAPHMGGAWAIVHSVRHSGHHQAVAGQQTGQLAEGRQRDHAEHRSGGPVPGHGHRAGVAGEEVQGRQEVPPAVQRGGLHSDARDRQPAGGSLLLAAYSLSDADGNKGFGLTDTESSKLIRNGKVVARSPYFGYIDTTGLPAKKATYTLKTSQTRKTYSKFSTRTDLSWTFTSAATAKETLLPMLGVHYQPKVNRHNVAKRKRVTVLPVVVDAQPGAALPRVKKLVIRVSGNNGKTWRKATVTRTGKGTYKAIFGTPKRAKTVSLKAHLIDAHGNITDQTVIGAYPLRSRS